MRNLEKKTILKLSGAIVITIISMSLFSIPILTLPSLGGVLFPGTGLWKVPGEVPEYELIAIPDISNDVTVIRDEWGVPHIYASRETDLLFAQGYCQAQDRLFQMDMWRRQVRGMLSEIVGAYALPSDKFNLAMGMEYWAIKTDEALREMEANGEIDFFDNLESYVNGINYYINTHKSELPMEYQLIGFEPTEWSTIDSLCLVQEMARQMTWAYDDFYRLLNLEAFGPTYYSELFSHPQPYQVPICPDYGDFPGVPSDFGSGYKSNPSLSSFVSNFLSGIQSIDSERELMETRDLRGSNNWVVNGIKSTTGKPILCNDMHLSWMLPGVWYEQHLFSSDTGLHTYGFAIPGMPLVAVGHNNFVAWGFTNTMYDVLDWYYYNKDGDTRYIYNGESSPFTTRTHTIKVKDQMSEEFTVKETVHGPVLSELRDFGISESIGDVVIAPRWTANDLYFNFLAGNGFNRATNRDEFDEASKYWDTLAQNIVYADIYGNIAIRPTGKVPIRDDSKIPPGHFGNGALPYNGSNGEGEWIGYVPFEELPNSKNPGQNYLASANQIVAGPNYPRNFLQNGYASGYRARRINELLANAPDGTVGLEKMIEVQNDVNSTAAQAFTPYLINAIEENYGTNPPSRVDNVLTELKNWGYVMDKELAAPSIYRKWRDYFMDYTFDDEIEQFEAIYGPSFNMLEYLMKEDENSHWFDDVNTDTITETRDDIILKAFDDAIDWLEEFYGSNDPSAWRWGDLHEVYFTHLLGLTAFDKGPYESSGEGYTVNPSGVNIMHGVGRARGGASERLIVDLSDFNNSLTVIPSGQRGLSNSKHYSDQLEDLFLEGKYHYQYFTNTPTNFPTNSIESTILFKPIGGA